MQVENDEQAQQTFEEWLNGQDQIDRMNGEHEARSAAFKDAVAQLEKNNVELAEKISACSAEPSLDEAVTTTERKSLLTMTIAKAVDG